MNFKSKKKANSTILKVLYKKYVHVCICVIEERYEYQCVSVYHSEHGGAALCGLCSLRSALGFT